MTLSLTQVFKVRLTHADRRRLVKLAAKKQITASALVRALIQQAVST